NFTPCSRAKASTCRGVVSVCGVVTSTAMVSSSSSWTRVPACGRKCSHWSLRTPRPSVYVNAYRKTTVPFVQPAQMCNGETLGRAGGRLGRGAAGDVDLDLQAVQLETQPGDAVAGDLVNLGGLRRHVHVRIGAHCQEHVHRLATDREDGGRLSDFRHLLHVLTQPFGDRLGRERGHAGPRAGERNCLRPGTAPFETEQPDEGDDEDRADHGN